MLGLQKLTPLNTCLTLLFGRLKLPKEIGTLSEWKNDLAVVTLCWVSLALPTELGSALNILAVHCVKWNGVPLSVMCT